MKKLTQFLALFICSFNVSATAIKTGDVLLISFNCYECRVIESETNSTFSHSGVVVRNHKGELQIAQSLGSVALYNLNDFLKNKTPNTKVAIYRPLEIDEKRSIELESKMLNVFEKKYQGIRFDSKYLWNNVDESGRELLYCSEFIAKYLDNFLSQNTVPYPLTYNKNYNYWLQYFRGVIPEGELGNSPSSFTRDNRFYFVGNLEE